MNYGRIERLIVPVTDRQQAIERLHRLGLRTTPDTDAATESLRVGFAAGAGEGCLEVELVTSAAPDEALPAVVLSVGDLPSALAELRSRGLATGSTTTGDVGAPLAELQAPAVAGTALRLGQRSALAVAAPSGAAGETASGGLGLKRLDHLAAQVADLEASTRFWRDVLGVPLYGEVRSPTTIVRQFKIGDAIMELLAPATAEAAAAPRQLGLARMAAFEVEDMGAAVSHARAAGFTVADPRPGTLPGTRVTQIPADELGSLRLQLLEYI